MLSVCRSLWERACSRRRPISQSQLRMYRRIREQARSHSLDQCCLVNRCTSFITTTKKTGTKMTASVAVIIPPITPVPIAC